MPQHKSPTDPPKQDYDLVAAESLSVSSPSLGTPTLTVGQIAEQLGTATTDVVATRERLRHWTREGLLSPVARHHSGTGTRRGYDPSSVYDAAILNAVARAGLHIVSRPYLLDALSMARQARQQRELAKDKGALFLEISHKAAGGGTVIAIHEGTVKCDPDAELSIVINLARIFEDVRMRARRNQGRYCSG
jgi:hypothetical protein